MRLKINEQNRLLHYSLNNGVGLSDILERKHLSYDDLSYSDELLFGMQNNPFDYVKTIEEVPRYNDGIPAISFFSGAGGLDIGFSYAGFKNLICIEHNELFCKTLRFNNKDAIIVGPPHHSGDISQRDEIKKTLIEMGVCNYFNGVFHGGPPCQSFSIAANQRYSKESDNFKRKGFEDVDKGGLIFDYIWFIKQFKPLAFLIENVSGIIECDLDGRVSRAIDELRNLGYIIPTPSIVDATYYGVPQHRKRWIAVGTRGKQEFIQPAPNLKETPCGYVFLRSLTGLSNHITRKHSAESVLRYSQLKPGERDKKGRVDRLDPFKPSKTVIAGGLKGGGRSHLHPFYPRTLSVRECARLQTFPDNYEFIGTSARQFTQVGNAVPPMLAYKYALAIKEAILPDYLAATEK